MITQSLIMAQECANDRVLQLENEQGDRDDSGEQTPKIISDTSIQNDFLPIQNLVQSPKEFEGTLAVYDCSRTAISQRKVFSWLDDLVSEKDLTLNSQSERSSIFSNSTSNSSSDSSRLSYLLSKWTDQGERWTRMREVNSRNEATAQLTEETMENSQPQKKIQTEIPSVQGQDLSQEQLIDNTRCSRPRALSLSKSIVASPPISPTHSWSTTSDTVTIVPNPCSSLVGSLTPPITPTAPPSAKIRTTFPSLDMETFKYVGISKEDSCKKVLKTALEVYDLSGSWRSLMLYIVSDDGERRLGLDEKPKAVYNQLCEDGKTAIFMIRRLPFLMMDPTSSTQLGF